MRRQSDAPKEGGLPLEGDAGSKQKAPAVAAAERQLGAAAAGRRGSLGSNGEHPMSLAVSCCLAARLHS